MNYTNFYTTALCGSLLATVNYMNNGMSSMHNKDSHGSARQSYITMLKLVAEKNW